MLVLAFYNYYHYLRASFVGDSETHILLIAYRMFGCSHANVAQMIGMSPEGSKHPFIVYRVGNDLLYLRLLVAYLLNSRANQEASAADCEGLEN